MSMTFQSIRFGAVEIAEQDVIEFPFGLIGLGGLRYALIDRNPGTGFLWLHSVEDPALALPVVRPATVLLRLRARRSRPRTSERTGIQDAAVETRDLRDGARHAQPARHHRQPARPAHHPRRPRLSGPQRRDDAPLQAPLFELAAEPIVAVRRESIDAA